MFNIQCSMLLYRLSYESYLARLSTYGPVVDGSIPNRIHRIELMTNRSSGDLSEKSVSEIPVGSEILEVFEECQVNSLSHDRLCIKLKNIYTNTRFVHFADDFFELCRYSLISSERCAYRERTIDFITKFALFCGKSETDDTQDTLNNRILLKLFLFCIKYHECSNPAVRFRCMQIIHKLLEGIGTNGILPDELYNNLLTVLLRRVYDTKSSVRVQAVQALCRMQDPTNASCPAVESFIWLARHDPTAEVRRAALAAMVLTTRTLPSLIERCRDLSDSVRHTAYKILAARSVLRPLSIAKRIRVLQDGLLDRSESVRSAARDLVLAWYKAVDKDPIMLLRRLDTEGVPETSQLTLDNLFTILTFEDMKEMVEKFASNHLTAERILKSDSQTAEAAFFWRAVIEFVQKKLQTAPDDKHEPEAGQDNMDADSNVYQALLDLIQPSVSTYVDMAKILVDDLVQHILNRELDDKVLIQECVIEQVLRLAASLDLSDEYGRRRLVALVHDWITNAQVPGTLASGLLKLHALLEPNLRRRVNNIIEMISELCDPVEPPPTPASMANDTGPSSSDRPTTQQGDQQQTTDDHEPAAVAGAAPTAGISKSRERAIRLKIASLEVQMNEINESLHNCVAKREFERATELRDACQKLDTERTELLQELRGDRVVPPVSRDPENSPSETGSTTAADKPQTNANDSPDHPNPPDEDDQAEDGDAKTNDDHGPQALLERCNASVLLKANQIAALIIQQSPTLWSLPASLRSLLDSLILPCIQHTDPSVRNHAILTLGLCCTMDLPLAIQYMPLFYSAMRVDHVMISETALRCIIDCLLIYGFQPFHEANIRPNAPISTTEDLTADDEDEEDETIASAKDFIVLTRQTLQNTTANSSVAQKSGFLVRRDEMSATAARLLRPIIALLESEYDDLRTTSALGLAKLLIYDRLVSSRILSLLLLLWFNPISEDHPAIRLGLACFFTDYACGNSATNPANTTGNYDHQTALAEAVLPTLTTLIRAPASSPLSEVEPYDVACLLARLTDTTHLKVRSNEPNPNLILNRPADGLPDDEEPDEQANKENEVGHSDGPNLVDNPHHDQLALLLATEVLKAPQSAEAKLYLRMLCQLRPSTSNLKVYKELLVLADSMSKYIDKSSILVLHRFRKQVNENIERLGLNPAQLLAQIHDTSQQQHRPCDSESTTRNPSDSVFGDDTETTLLANQSDPALPVQPTLLGSGRTNLVLLDDNGASQSGSNQGPNLNRTVVFSQLNRTMQSSRILDKSKRNNLLTFSDDEDSDGTLTPVNETQSKSTSNQPINGASAPKPKAPTKTKPLIEPQPSVSRPTRAPPSTSRPNTRKVQRKPVESDSESDGTGHSTPASESCSDTEDKHTSPQSPPNSSAPSSARSRLSRTSKPHSNSNQVATGNRVTRSSTTPQLRSSDRQGRRNMRRL